MNLKRWIQLFMKSVIVFAVILVISHFFKIVSLPDLLEMYCVSAIGMAVIIISLTLDDISLNEKEQRKRIYQEQKLFKKVQKDQRREEKRLSKNKY